MNVLPLESGGGFSSGGIRGRFWGCEVLRYLAHAIMQEAQDEEQGKGNDKGICKPWRKACEMNQPFEKYINCQAGKRYC